MISIQLNKVGKKFGSEWIFRSLDHSILPSEKIVILGGNGSGKSTLLQMIGGYVTPNEGDIQWQFQGKAVDKDEVCKLTSLASPYLQLIEDYTLLELVEHVAELKPFRERMSPKDVIQLMELSEAKNKLIRQFSSGMKQRVKLALAILSDTPLLLLDEPVSNLDRNAINWYRKLIAEHTDNRTLVICSNSIGEEYDFCTSQLNVQAYKPSRIVK